MVFFFPKNCAYLDIYFDIYYWLYVEKCIFYFIHINHKCYLQYPLQIVIVRSGVKRSACLSFVRGLIVVPIPVGRGLFARQRVAERAGWPVADCVHGAAVDGLSRPAVRGQWPWPGQRQRAPLPVTRTGLRLFGHQQVRALWPGGGARPRQWPSSDRTRGPKRGGRCGHAHHCARAAAAVGAYGLRRPSGLLPFSLRQALGHEIMSVRRHFLHAFLRATHKLVITLHRGQRPVRVRPLWKTGPVHGQSVELFAAIVLPGPEALCRRHRGPAALGLRSRLFVRLPEAWIRIVSRT